MITVRTVSNNDPLEFEVAVREGNGETRHRVTMRRADYLRLAGGKVSESRCIESCFAFLLDREPKESILSRFDVRVIADYFPGFERDLPGYF